MVEEAGHGRHETHRPANRQSPFALTERLLEDRVGAFLADALDEART